MPKSPRTKINLTRKPTLSRRDQWPDPEWGGNVVAEFCFTLSVKDPEAPLPFDPKTFRYICWQPELYQSGEIHLQGYFELNRKDKLADVNRKKFSNRAHLEVRMAETAQEAVAYCEKIESKAGPFQSYGTLKQQGKRSDLEEIHAHLVAGGKLDPRNIQHARAIVRNGPGYERLQQALRREKAQEFRNVNVILHVGRKSDTNKSRLAREETGLPVCRVRSVRGTSDQVFGAYTDEPVLILDEYRGGLEYGLLLDILDGYPLDAPARFENKWALWTTVYITSNLFIDEWYPALTKEELEPLARRIKKIRHFTDVGVFQELRSPFKPV